MYDSSPLHRALWAQELVETLRSRGFSDREIFRDTGLSAHALTGEHAAAPAGKIAALFENAATLLDDDLLGFRYGQRREMRRNGLITYVGLSSPTLMDALKNLSRYVRVFSDAVVFETNRLEKEGICIWHMRVSDTVRRGQHNEFQVAGLVKSLREAANRRFSLAEVTFRHPRNRNIDAFVAYFGCEVRFGAETNLMRFHMHDLATPLRTADEHLHKVLVEHCETVLDRKRPMQPGIVYSVEKAVAARLSAGEANQDKIAATLGVSRRTLSRRLSEQGTSFHRIVEDLRKSLATNYLKDSDLPQHEIAFLLGYADLSSYVTAFKRWTGATPAQYRKSA